MQLGVIGLGTMGANLARNAARNGAHVAVFNRTSEKTDEFMKHYGSEGDFVPCKSGEEFLGALTSPRVILIMVKAGPPVDQVIDDLLPHLAKGDVLIDGGNSHYTDTERRVEGLNAAGIEFIGMGVSGGEEGALHGPSMMPGCTEQAWKIVEPLFTKMAADDGEGGKCVSRIGEGGSGHFVKMVHNGIEYGIMQLIAESYDILKSIGSFTNNELAELYAKWNESELLRSFLIEITAKIFAKKDDVTGTGELIDMILDEAAQKGTGKWTTEAAFQYGVAVPTITAAVDARMISGSVTLRNQSKMMPAYFLEGKNPSKEELAKAVQQALEQSIIFTYEQGFALMRVASDNEHWNLNFGEVARIWRAGCIIRSSVLKLYQDSYAGGEAANKAWKIILDCFNKERQHAWRQVIQWGVGNAIPLPAMSASLTYFDAHRRERLPQNLVQAQRDFFGAHTYERRDQEGTFHTNWES